MPGKKSKKIYRRRKSIFKDKGAISDKGAFYVVAILMLLFFGSFVMVGGSLPTIRSKDNKNYVMIYTPVPGNEGKQLQLYTFRGATYTPTPPPPTPTGEQLFPTGTIPLPPDIPVPPCTHYVAKNGSDSNPGTESQPWLTIQHAVNSAVAAKTICVKTGTYNEKISITKSGIIVIASPALSATIDGTGLSPGFWNGLVDISNTSNVVIKDLKIINAMDAAGIGVHFSAGVTLKGNFIQNTQNSGIMVAGGSGNKAIGNELYQTSGRIQGGSCGGNQTQESISFSGSPNFEIAYNYVHDVGGSSGCGNEGIDAKTGSSNGTIHHNRVVQSRSVGIYIDSWDKIQTNVSVYDNFIDNGGGTGIGISSEETGTIDGLNIYNNISIGSDAGIRIPTYQDGSTVGYLKNIKITNNTVSNNNYYGIWIGQYPNTVIQNLTVRNNIFSRNSSTQLYYTLSGSHSGITIDSNLIFPYDSSTRGANSVTADPLFISTSDLHLKAGSTAINKGSATGAPATDFDGKARPQGGGFDIGAYEQ